MTGRVLLLSVLVVCLMAALLVQAEPANFQKIYLNTINSDAVCNDGSPAVYFFRPGYGSGANIWTIYLEGGGFCQDIPSCQWRWQNMQHLMTSNQLPEILNDTTWSLDVNHGGINSGNATANPYFYNANQAYLWYCSSDSHASNIPASNATGGWQFRGKLIIQTMINHLLKQQTPPMTQAKQILLSGFSAGAFGVINNADYVQSMVQAAAPGAQFKAYVDSGWLLDIPDYAPWDAQERDTMATMYQNLNVEFDDSCLAVFAPLGEAWRCQFGVYVYPFISTPLFVAGHQYDMPFLNDVSPPFNETTGEYAIMLRDSFLMQTTPIKGFFAPGCYCHGIEAYDARWNFITINGVSASTAVWNFLNNKPSHYIDSCPGGFNCNPTCTCEFNPHS